MKFSIKKFQYTMAPSVINLEKILFKIKSFISISKVLRILFFQLYLEMR